MSILHRRFPWAMPILFLAAALTVLFTLQDQLAARMTAVVLAAVQTFVCAVLFVLSVNRLRVRYGDYLHALRMESASTSHRHMAVNYELLMGFVMVLAGEAFHNAITVAYQVRIQTGGWPVELSAAARAVEVAGLFYCVRAISLRTLYGEGIWLACAIMSFAMGTIPVL